MKLSVASKTILGVTCLLFILGSAGSLTLEQRERQIQSRLALLHTYQVIGALEELELALNEAETGQRGFILTGNERYLAPLEKAGKKLDGAINQIRSLTKDNSDQQQHIGSISTLTKEKLRELEKTVSLRRESGFEAALKEIKNDSGQRFMEEMRTRIEEMKSTEQSLLKNRSQKLDAITKRSWSTLVQLLLLTMATIAVASGVLYKIFMAGKRSQADVEEKKQMLQIMLDTMSDGVIIADTKGNFVVFNPSAEEMFGKLISIDPQKWSEHFGIFESDCVTAVPPENLPLSRAMRGESVDDMEIFVRSADRPQGRWVLINARPIDSPSYRFKGGMVVCRDVSERKEAEKRVSEFYSMVSHELRTPLTSIRASLGLIEGGIGGEVSDKAKKLVIIARQASDRLIRLINDILDISKIEAGKFELAKKKVEIETLANKTLDGIAGMAHEKGVSVTKELKTSGPLDCDEDRIIQVLTNLISNAIKFSPQNSEVILRLEPGSSGFFKFSVIDEGPGIPKEQMHKLFEKFQQLDSTDARKNEGTGLGLAISKALIESHGGKMGVESEVGKGSSFWIELPASFNPRMLSDKEEKNHGNHPALIVEDDDGIYLTLKEHLMLDGFSIARAATIAEAEQFLKDVKPFVIILDLNLPDGSGIDFFQKLSHDKERRDVPVVVVTATERGSNLFGEAALIDWITKPFDEDRLHRALDIAREKHGPAKILLVENDAATRETVKTQLESIGAKCIEAEDGASALTAIRQENPDLIILDLDIPAPDGYAVVDILKNEKHHLKPLIIYTASDLNEDQRQRLQLGLSAHLTKSRTTQEDLVQTVRAFLNGLLLGKEPKN